MDKNEFADFEDDFSHEDFAPPAPEAPERDEQFPPPFPLDGLDMLTPPGFVGSVAAWIDSQCRYPRRRLAVASAIVTVGNIGGLRHYDTRDGITANMLAFCVAASSTGKEAVQQAMAQLHIAAGVHYALHGGIKSEQEIMRNLIDNQAAYYIVDEIGIFLTKVRNAQKRGGAAYLEGVFGAIMATYSKASSTLILNGDIKRDLRKLYSNELSRAMNDDDESSIARATKMLAMVDGGLDRPFLSMVGYTTPSTFDGSMDGETATQGFVGRAIIVNETDINPAGRKDFQKRKLPNNIAMRLSQIFTGGQYDPNETKRVEFYGQQQPINTDDDASVMLDQVADWLHSYAEEMGEHTGEASVAMIRRGYEQIAKISFILAIPEGRRTAEHVRWAFAYVRAELDAKVKLVFANDNQKARPEESLAARIHNFIDPEKGATSAVLSSRMKVDRAKIEAVLAKMAAAGTVEMREGPRVYKGKKVRTWHVIGE